MRISLEHITRTAMLSVAVLSFVVIARREFFIDYSKLTGIKPGDNIALPESPDGTKTSLKQAVLVLSSNCHFCTESAPFYRELTALSKRDRRFDVIVAMPQDLKVARSYLDTLGIAADRIYKVNTADLRVQGTPTLIMASSDRKVLEVWTGKLDDSSQQRVVQRLQALNQRKAE